MKTLVFANQKGGVGKTTALVHMAWFFAEKGKKVCVLDLDHQQNASFTLSKYGIGISASAAIAYPATAGPKVVVAAEASTENITLIGADHELLELESTPPDTLAENLRILLASITNAFDVLFIDTTPALGTRLAAALMVADYVLSPIELEVYSLQGIAMMVTTIKNIQGMNDHLKFLGMLPSRVVNSPRHREHLEQLKKAYPKLLLPVALSMRSSVADAVASNQPVWKIKKTAARKAATEMRQLGTYLLNKLEA